MALILEAAGVPEETVVRLLTRSMAGRPAAAPGALPDSAATPTSTQHLRAGHVIDAYRLEERLGRGFSAVVWKASVVGDIPGVQLRRGDTVAIKLYLPALVQGFETLRIQREFAVAAELRHPNLARVYDLVLSPSRPLHAFMVMELVQGGTLRSAIESQGRLIPLVVFRLAEQLFSALDEIHSQDALHRDVKAANIMVPRLTEREVEIKLVDLGIVSVPSEEKLTQASVFLGSKHSAPLEQLTGQRMDERTDIYGAGSVLYHALTGQPMYANAGPEGAIVVRMLNSPDTLDVMHDDTPSLALLKGLVNRCISVKSSDRPRTAKECLAELRRIRSRTP
jgi:serine/threonine-protein kinase